MHPDHCWAALCVAEALRSLFLEHYETLSTGARLPSSPPWAFRRWFTFTLPEAIERFDYFAELMASTDELVELDVVNELDRVQRAYRAYETQLHWVRFLERVNCIGLPRERFVERFVVGASAKGRDCLLSEPWGDSTTLTMDLIPRPSKAYTSTDDSFHKSLMTRAAQCSAWSVRAVVLASGHGTRMGHPTLPKSLVPVRGRPLLRYIVESLRASLVDEAPVIVVGPRGERIVESFRGGGHAFVDQGPPRGTGHAVLCALPTLEKLRAENVLIVLGDMPLLTASTFRALVSKHFVGDDVITMATCMVEDFEGWRSPFRSFGRIVRDTSGEIVAIVEARERECDLSSTEVNPSLYCVRTKWLAKALRHVGEDNASGERYLTDIVALARNDGFTVGSFAIDAEEALGLNTPEEVSTAESLLQSRERRDRTLEVVHPERGDRLA